MEWPTHGFGLPRQLGGVDRRPGCKADESPLGNRMPRVPRRSLKKRAHLKRVESEVPTRKPELDAFECPNTPLAREQSLQSGLPL